MAVEIEKELPCTTCITLPICLQQIKSLCDIISICNKCCIADNYIYNKNISCEKKYIRAKRVHRLFRKLRNEREDVII